MDSNTKVKDCPLRRKYHEGVRSYGSVTWWGCHWPEGHMERRGDSENEYSCKLHGSSKLSKCEDYNYWSEKQVRDAFEKLEKTEKSLAAIGAIKQM